MYIDFWFRIDLPLSFTNKFTCQGIRDVAVNPFVILSLISFSLASFLIHDGIFEQDFIFSHTLYFEKKNCHKTIEVLIDYSRHRNRRRAVNKRRAWKTWQKE